jgi:hypothetical protein
MRPGRESHEERRHMDSERTLALKHGDLVRIYHAVDDTTYVATVDEVIDCRGADVEPSNRSVRLRVWSPLHGWKTVDRRRVIDCSP